VHAPRFARMMVSAYAGIEPWKDDHDNAMVCFHIEDAVSWGNVLFKGLSEEDATWHTYVLESKIEYDESHQKELLEAYRTWLETSMRLLSFVERLEESGFEVRGSGELRRNCAEAKGILTDDDQFFVGDALTELRDEAVDEHRRGGTQAYQDCGNA
jgi:hypothetical protein